MIFRIIKALAWWFLIAILSLLPSCSEAGSPATSGAVSQHRHAENRAPDARHR